MGKVTESGTTLLHAAAAGGQTDVIRLLLSHEAAVDAQ